MDSVGWHQFCMQLASHAIPVTARDVHPLSSADLTKYAAEVHRSLLRAPAISPIHEDVACDLRDSWDLVQAQPLGARTILALDADFGLGKSTLATRFAREIYMGEVADQIPSLVRGELPSRSVRLPGPVGGRADADYVPVLYLNLQSDTASKDLLSQVLSFLGHGTHATRGELASRAIAALGTHGVKLFVVDDAHMLRTHLRQGRATLDALKHLATELGSMGGGMMVVGAFIHHPDVLDDPQMRVRMRISRFTPYQAESPSGRRQWQRLLKNWECRLRPYLPDLEPGLLSRHWAGPLFQRTQGFASDVAVIVADATRNALMQRRTTLDRSIPMGGRVSQRGIDGTASTPRRKAAHVRRRDAG